MMVPRATAKGVLACAKCALYRLMPRQQTCKVHTSQVGVGYKPQSKCVIRQYQQDKYDCKILIFGS